MFLEFDSPLSNTDFVSIVVLSFTRPKHLRYLLESIHEHADMPYEIVVSDDGSRIFQDSDKDVFKEARDLCSTLIFNNGANMGFAASANKATALANSEYILFMNDDTAMTGASLRLIRDVLQRPYIGSFGPWQGIEPVGGHPDRVNVQIGDKKLQLGSLPSGSSIFAYRKSLWQELGGFPQVYHNGGDIAFLHKMCASGFFSASNIIDPEPSLFRNIDVEENYRHATYTRSPFDSSYPPIFGVPEIRTLHKEREARIYKFSHAEYEKPLGLHNTESWKNYFSQAKLENQNNYDWSNLSRFGQDRWKEAVESDLVEM